VRRHGFSTRPRTRTPPAAIAALALGAALLAPAQPAAAAKVPDTLVPEGATPYLRAHAIGTQNYVCVVTGSGPAWKFVGPTATLFVGLGPFVQQLTTHFLSPNPEESGTARATWQGSFDSSRVWAKAIVAVDDPKVIGPGNIPWLLLQRAGAQRGPTGGSLLSQATYVQRINTTGGVPPATGCSAATDAGAMALVPYGTDYVFFR
jgi:hypothetical protein